MSSACRASKPSSPYFAAARVDGRVIERDDKRRASPAPANHRLAVFLPYFCFILHKVALYCKSNRLRRRKFLNRQRFPAAERGETKPQLRWR